MNAIKLVFAFYFTTILNLRAVMLPQKDTTGEPVRW